MDIVLWMLTGGLVGWASYSFLRFNEARGMQVSIVIGAVGALIGGEMIAPSLIPTVAAPDGSSAFGLLFVAAVAAAFLALGNLVHDRWGA